MQRRSRRSSQVMLTICLVTCIGVARAETCTPAFFDLGPESILDQANHTAVSAALIGCAETLDTLTDDTKTVARSLVAEALTRHGSVIASNTREVSRELTTDLTKRLGRSVASDVFLFGFSRLEPASQVTLATSRSNSGWRVIFHLADHQAVREILYRFDDRGDFRSTGFRRSRDPHTGQAGPLTWVKIPDRWMTPGQHQVAVKLVRFDDRIDGPFELGFNVESEILSQAKHALAMTRNNWISFTEREATTYLMFTHVLSFKDALREIRYSVDDCSLSERFELEDWTDVTRPPASTEEKPYLGLPTSTRSACLQLVFRDGTESEIEEVRRDPS